MSFITGTGTVAGGGGGGGYPTFTKAAGSNFFADTNTGTVSVPQCYRATVYNAGEVVDGDVGAPITVNGAVLNVGQRLEFDYHLDLSTNAVIMVAPFTVVPGGSRVVVTWQV